jgi:hypothetical protein
MARDVNEPVVFLDSKMAIIVLPIRYPYINKGLTVIGYPPVFLGAPSRIRTCGPQIRSLMLYPAELWAQFFCFANMLRSFCPSFVFKAGVAFWWRPCRPRARATPEAGRAAGCDMLKWRRERDSNPRYTFKGRTIA